MRYNVRVFNIGTGELIMIAVVALLVLGPKRLPELARGLGKFLREFRRQTDEVRNVVEREFYRMDEEEKKAEVAKVLPAPGIEPVSVSPGGDDLHNPDGTLKAAPGPVKVPEQAAGAPSAAEPAAAVPASNGAAPAAPAAPAATPVTEAAPAPAPADDHLPPGEAIKSQLTAGLDHSDPRHPDYYKDDAPAAETPAGATEKPTG